VSSLVIASEYQVVKRTELNGSFNTQRFCAFLQELHIPRGSVILLDNVSFHHSKAALEVVQRKGIVLLFTPPYSPWFNPIEGIFSIVKRQYYKDGNIDGAFNAVTLSHCSAFFRKSFSI
jgi:transposase